MGFEVLDPTNEAAPPLGQWRRGRGRCGVRPSGSSPTAKRGRRVSSRHLDRMLREEFGVAV